MINTRENIIIKTSRRDMLANLIIGILELILGILSNSVAVTSDGVNSFASSAIALINIRGIKLAKKPADREHPYGYGRNEYLTIVVIAALLIVISFILVYESVMGIFFAGEVSYPYYAMILIGVSVCIKIYLGRHAKKTGNKLKAASLCLIGRHTLLEAALEIATMASIMLSILADVSLDAYLGLFVAVVIFITGINIAKDYLETLIGHNISPELAKEIKGEIAKDEIIMGAYDLSVHDYGHNNKMGTCNVEIDETHSLNEAYEVINIAKKRIKDKYEIDLNIEIYSVNVYDKEIVALREKCRAVAISHDTVLGMHGFYLNHEKKIVKMDIVIDYSEKDPDKLIRTIKGEVHKILKGYKVFILVDRA